MNQLSAQHNFEDKLLLAKEYYANGDLVQSQKTLEEYKDSLKIANSDYFKLKAKIKLVQDSLKEAKGLIARYINSKSGNYLSDDDPQLFKDILLEVEDSLSERCISSVSKRAEDKDLTAATVIVLKENEFIQRGYNDLIDLLSDQPGFDISRIYSANYANVYQRGFRQENTERTLLMIDGIEENDVWSNIAYISRQYPLSNISAIEIIYGPASTIYGPRAFVGAINIITKSHNDLIGDSHRKAKLNGIDIRANAKALGGSYGTKGVDLSIGAREKKSTVLFTAKVFSTDERDLSKVSFYNYDANDIDLLDYDGAKLKKLMYINNPITTVNELTQQLNRLKIAPSSPYYNYFLGYGTDTLRVNPDSLNALINMAKSIDKSRYKVPVNGQPISYSNKSMYYYLGGKVKTENFEAGIRTWRSQEGFNYYQDLYAAGSDNGSKWIPTNTTFYTVFDKQLDNFLISGTTSFTINSLDKNTSRVSYNSFYGLLNPNPYSSLSMFHLLFPDSIIDGKKQGWQNTFFYYTAKQFRNDLRVNYSKNNLNIVNGIEFRSSQLQGDYLTYTNYSSSQKPDQNSGAFAATLGTVSNQDQGSNQYSVIDLGLYSQLNYQLIDTSLYLTAGGRYDFNRIRSNEGFGGIFNPKIALIASRPKLILKLIFSRGIQGPSQWTKYSTGGGRSPNGTLKPEKIQNYEFTLQNRHGIQALNWDLSCYYSIILDAISSAIDPKDNVLKNLNNGKYSIAGAQANVNYIPAKASWSIYSNYTFTKAKQTANISQIDFQGKTIADIATFKSNFGVNYHFKQHQHLLNINARANYVGNKPVGQNTTVEKNTGLDQSNAIPAYLIFNTTFSYKNSNWDKVSIQFSIFNLLGLNLLDAKHKDYYSPGPRTANANSVDSYNGFVPWVPQHNRSYFITLNFNL